MLNNSVFSWFLCSLKESAVTHIFFLSLLWDSLPFISNLSSPTQAQTLFFFIIIFFSFLLFFFFFLLFFLKTIAKTVAWIFKLHSFLSKLSCNSLFAYPRTTTRHGTSQIPTNQPHPLTKISPLGESRPFPRSEPPWTASLMEGLRRRCPFGCPLWLSGDPPKLLDSSGLGTAWRWWPSTVAPPRMLTWTSMIGCWGCSGPLWGSSLFREGWRGTMWSMWSGSFCIGFSALPCKCLPLR